VPIPCIFAASDQKIWYQYKSFFRSLQGYFPLDFLRLFRHFPQFLHIFDRIFKFFVFSRKKCFTYLKIVVYF